MAKLDLELEREVGSRSWIAKLDLKLDCEVGSRSWIAKLGREVGSEVGSRSWIFLAPLDVTFEVGFPYSPLGGMAACGGRARYMERLLLRDAVSFNRWYCCPSPVRSGPLRG